MFTSEVNIRVRYAETDKMGYVYYGNYATYFEVARVEALRDTGISYKDLEDMGIMLPVLEMKNKFIRPARYDQLLTIKTTVKELPTSRWTFYHEVFNENKELLNVSEVTLVFVDAKLMKPMPAPAVIMDLFAKYFKQA